MPTFDTSSLEQLCNLVRAEAGSISRRLEAFDMLPATSRDIYLQVIGEKLAALKAAAEAVTLEITQIVNSERAGEEERKQRERFLQSAR